MNSVSSLVLSFCLFIISTYSDDVVKCHEGWYQQGGFCYSYGESRVSWADAQEVCRSYGGKLAEIESADENTFIKNLISNKQAVEVWIGGTDILSEGHWEWVTSGQSIGPFSDWGPGQPGNDVVGDHEDCLQFAKDLGYKWNDLPCAQLANFVCEAELNPLAKRKKTYDVSNGSNIFELCLCGIYFSGHNALT